MYKIDRRRNDVDAFDERAAGERSGHIGIAVSPSGPARVLRARRQRIRRRSRAASIVPTIAARRGRTRRRKAQKRIWQRGWYFGGITADPKNPDVVYVMNTATYRSIDGGKTFDAIKGSPGGDDYHTLWIEPNDPRTA